jgi:hypothetical protein
MFVPDEDSQTYGEGLRRGRFLLTARAEEHHADRVHQLLENSNAVDVDERASAWRIKGWGEPSSGGAGAFSTPQRSLSSGSTSDSGSFGGASAGGATAGTSSSGSMGRSDNDQTIPVIEEQLAVGKREMNRGGVRVRSFVRKTPVHEQVSLREEHVDVERRPVNQALQSGDLADAF